MRNSKIAYKVALCGVFSALSLVLMMLTTVIPVGTYALPIISGALLSAIVIEFNAKWALAVYFAVSVLSFLLSGDKEAVLYFAMFFGFYPIIKSYFERLKSKVLQWILKYAAFNLCMIGAFFIGTYLLGVPLESYKIFGWNLPIVFLLIGDIAFVFYDRCVTLVILNYINYWRKKLIKP
ncbi:MAG: hypothetical protein PUD24_03380 [Oscillospiraceae bacterium]|nr:hypothetical protein [Oscillospiraceae bacterium]